MAAVSEESIQAIGREIIDDARRLVQLEIELAKAEMVGAMKRIALGAALVAVALVLVLVAVVYLIGSLPDNLLLLDHWWGWDATGGALLIIAGIIGLVAARIIRRGIGSARGTAITLKGDVDWARQLPSRRSNSSS